MDALPLMTLEQFRANAGFPVDDLIRQMKNELGVAKCRVMFDNPNAQAMSRHGPDGVLEIHLPTLDTILRQRPGLSREEAIAKIKAQVAEELCHGVYHETNHDDRVVSCTIKEMREHMNDFEFNSPYIQEKVVRLRGAAAVVSGMPLR